MTIFHKGEHVYCKKKDGREILASYHYACGRAHCVWAGGQDLYLIKPEDGEEIRYATPKESKIIEDKIRATFDAMLRPTPMSESKIDSLPKKNPMEMLRNYVKKKEEEIKAAQKLKFEVEEKTVEKKEMTDFELLTVSVDAL